MAKQGMKRPDTVDFTAKDGYEDPPQEDIPKEIQGKAKTGNKKAKKKS